MKPRYNSHYGRYSKNVYYAATSVEKAKPTEKQKKFFNGLCVMCRENGLPERTGKALHSRVDYSRAINILMERLKSAGVEVKDNGKKFTECVEIGMDDRGKDYVRETLEVDNG